MLKIKIQKKILEQQPAVQKQNNQQIKTFGELKKLVNSVINKERLKTAGAEATKIAVDQIVGLIPGASNVKSAFDFFKSIYNATDDKKQIQY